MKSIIVSIIFALLLRPSFAQNLQFNSIKNFIMTFPVVQPTGNVPYNQVYSIQSFGINLSSNTSSEVNITLSIDTTGASNFLSSNTFVITESSNVNSSPVLYKADTPIWIPSGASYKFGANLGSNGSTKAFVNIVVYDIVP